MINRIVLILSAVAGLGIALFVVYQLGASNGYALGYAKGESAAKDQCQAAQLDALQEVIDSTAGLTTAANTASQELGKTISARKQADAKATKEIRDALASTAPERAGCVFDASVMQQLDNARGRAAEAAASGVRGTVPAAR
ncbi:hypothetical protein [Pseudomonas peli]|uniref:hypothetical protein n=1 Tax=Pseudomonas peli TaxID=592361 RepID=UPI00285DB975|nr:hypothetical protein [Pseudomonas peli]MDR7024376.1 hypothetical protein [Pseudomonas peli]